MSDNAFDRTRRLLILIPAVAKAGNRGLSFADAARLTGAKSVNQVLADVESLDGLALGPEFPEDVLFLEIENDRIYATYTLQLVAPVSFSLREGAALVAALRPFEEVGGSAVTSASRKLRRGVPSYLRPAADRLASATDFKVGPPGEWADALQEAIDKRLEITVEYRADATADATRKVLEPRIVFPQNGHWYLAAWNVEKEEEHLYRLDRVVQVVLGTRVFATHKGPPMDRYARKQLYVQSGAEREVQVRFRGIAARIATERWPDQSRAEADGAVIVTAKLTPGPYLYGWVLGFGGEAELVSPEDVRTGFLAHVEQLRTLYAQPAQAATT